MIRPALTYFSKLMASDGYGRAAELHLMSLLAAGADVFVRPTGDWSDYDTAPDVHRLAHKPRLPTRWGILHDWPPSEWGVGDCRWHLGYTMIEGTRAPKWYVDAVNRYAVALLVPCTQNVAALIESGVRRPIRVVPHGLDGAYPWGDRTAGRPVTFGTLGTLTPRKGTDILLRCWHRAFPPGDQRFGDVRLEIKVRGPYHFDAGDPRVSILRGEWTKAEVRDWYHGLTAYVLPSRGEGFSLTACEAMRAGCGVVATDWGGPADYMDDAYCYPLPITGLRDTRKDHPDGPDFGQWAVPDEDALVGILRKIAGDPAAARAKGRRASAEMIRRFPLSLPGAGILRAMEELA